MRKAVILSLDAMFDEDIACLPENSVIRELLNEGASCTHVKTIFPSLTYPTHVTLITGCDPAQHGIGHNQPFQPGISPVQRKWYWDLRQIGRETLFSAVKRQGGRCASILWPVTGRTRDIRWNFPEVLALPGENQVLKMLQYGTAPWILQMELRHGRERVSTKEPYLSDYAAVLACDVIRSHQPELTCVHMVALDEARHRHGVHSREAQEAMLRLDRNVGAIRDTIRSTPGMEDALLIIVSDHGQADINHTVNLTARLSGDGWTPDRVGIQSCGMSAYVFVRNKTDIPEFLRYLQQHAEHLGIYRIFDRSELNDMGCIAQVDLAVDAMPGVVFSDALDQKKRESATHGYAPGHPAENCLFIVCGNGIRSAVNIPVMRMRDVAPTVASLMGVSLPEADGEDYHLEMV